MKYLVLCAVILLPVVIFAEEIEKIELAHLHGNWEGVGSFKVPVAGTELSIEGAAEFTYDETYDRLRTSLTGEKFMFSYSDSGYLTINPVNDSVTWEVWDNRNRHAFYKGIRDGNKIIGDRIRKKDIYEVTIIQPTRDSIEFKLTVTEPDGDSYNKAVFNLWRVKEDN